MLKSLAPPNALLALGGAVGAVVVTVLVVAGVVLGLAVPDVVLAAAAVVGVVPAAVVVVELGAAVVVVVFDDELCDVFLAALGVPEPHAAAIRPPASTMVPSSHRVRFRLGSASVVPRVMRSNPNTNCSSHRCGAPCRHARGREKLRRPIPNQAT